MEIYCKCACGAEFKEEGDELALNGQRVIEVQYSYWEKQHATCQYKVNDARYRWLRENPDFETRYFLSKCTPEQYDALVDAWRERHPNGVKRTWLET